MSFHLSADEYQQKVSSLAKSPLWQKLLHYHPGLLGGFKSRVDNASFFLTAGGKADPKKELEAAILELRSFEEGNKDLQQNLFPCRMPARYQFVAQHFSSGARTVKCSKFDSFKKEIKAKGISLIFASSYSENPGSVFGHTFLRLNKGHLKQHQARDLFDYILSFSANAPPPGSRMDLVYAMKGLLGGYEGIFEINPYYVKVTEYTLGEDRELYEYDLKLTQTQIDRVVAHIWEVINLASFDYYFLDDNCALMILAIIEVAVPKLNLTSQNPFYVSPIDVVKNILKEKKMIKKRGYRPSLEVKKKAALENLNAKEKSLVESTMKNKNALSDLSNLKVLDALIATNNYQKTQQKSEFDTLFYRQLLNKRAAIKLPSAPVIYNSSKSDPEQAHDTSAVGVQVGNYEHSIYYETRLKLLLHDVVNIDKGYVKDSHINVGDLKLRYYPKLNAVKLQKFSLYDIFALVPISKTSHPLSWSSYFGVSQRPFCSSQFCLAGIFKGEIGYAAHLEFISTTFYGLLSLMIETGKKLEQHYRLGFNPVIGAVATFYERFKFHLCFQPVSDLRPKHQKYNQFVFGSEMGIGISKNIDLRIGLKKGWGDFGRQEMSLGGHFFF